MTRPDLCSSAKALHDQRSIVRFFSPHGFVQIRAKWILSYYPDDQRRLRFEKRFGRPVDELRKIEQKHSFDLIFRGRSGLRRQVQPAPKQKRGDDQPPLESTSRTADSRRVREGFQKRHTTVP